MDRCPICNEIKNSWSIQDGQRICTDCRQAIAKQEIIDKAMQSTDSRYFKDWSSKDRTTAFFEVFGRYVKAPNAQDIEVVNHIWLWAVHADHALAKTISYTMQWAKMDLHTERKRWKQV